MIEREEQSQQQKNKRAPHVYIVGQTASGKTTLSLEIADALKNCEILNTDSLLFYKGLDIGTAKPSLEEQKKIPHHLIDICEPGEELTASDFLDNAQAVLSGGFVDKFLCVGGSGFYVNALDVGLLPLPATDPQIKKDVLKISDPVEYLQKVDSDIFDKISKNDLYRVYRALEVYEQTGKPLSQWQKEYRPKAFAKKIALNLDRDVLRSRISERAKKMIKEGLLEETESMLQKKHREWKPLASVGYAQAVKYIDGKYGNKDEMVEEIINKTMQLSKRQKTWFKKDKSVHWFEFNEQEKAKNFVVKAFKEDLWKA